MNHTIDQTIEIISVYKSDYITENIPHYTADNRSDYRPDYRQVYRPDNIPDYGINTTV